MTLRVGVHELSRFQVGAKFAREGWPPLCFYRVIVACELDEPPPARAWVPVELVLHGRPYERLWLTCTARVYVPCR